jgi:hypothetical protein
METAKSRDFLWGFTVSRIKLVIVCGLAFGA